MGRGGWKFQAWAAGAMMVLSALLALIRLVPSHEWDPVSFWLYTALFLLSVIQLLRLLRVRRNDAPFWDEDEARRDDWERRGRRL
jgi:protein-S-isoprenylcysteine O-methyltransferase Ste14